MTDVREWAQQYMDRGFAVGDVPIYGSDEWHELADDDPRRVAACVRSAERYRRDNEPEAIAAQLRQEMAEHDYLVRMRIAEASRDVHAAFSELPDPAKFGPRWADRKRGMCADLQMTEERYDELQREAQGL